MRIYGMHSVLISNSVEIFFIVMENIFPPTIQKEITEKFDIKGSWKDRFVDKHQQQPDKVIGKDENLMLRERFLYVTPQQKLSVTRMLDRDAQFLYRNGIMDYSLLIGFRFTKPGKEVEHADKGMAYNLFFF
jgi:hypothetical protein